MVKELRFGSKINFKGKKFFVEEAGPRVIKARRLFPSGSKVDLGDVMSHAITKIKVKDFRKKKR